MGTIAFLTIALGSLIFGGQLDRHGRKRCLIAAASVTPIVQITLLLLPQISLASLYIALAFVGLAGTLRASSAYILATEGLPASHRL